MQVSNKCVCITKVRQLGVNAERMKCMRACAEFYVVREKKDSPWQGNNKDTAVMSKQARATTFMFEPSL